MLNPKTFLYDLSENGVATITLNRPERLNALTFEVYRELTDTFAKFRTEEEVRVVVITGAGRLSARAATFTTSLVNCSRATWKACWSLRG